ncbi:MAG: hypothetical protein MUO39_00800 [Steroidobacteraceae bacterium]|nr:hypothetical protein [Steroidobacteraceae bacterium]
MNWAAIGAIGEIVGAMAVVVSLVYLAIQIREQNKESRLAAMHEIAVAYRESNIPFADANLADILTRAHDDTTQLTEAEIVQLIVGGNAARILILFVGTRFRFRLAAA